ncbi:hypothetical protein BS330_38645 [Amycolatopsis keratiniphila subsp. nogabecina]|nr:hypothetical protein BS330_38645 [Amycolatopsis keratiniphila subsp. nogabecina]
MSVGLPRDSMPQPKTQPRPPVVVACTSPATADLAARGLPMLLGLHMIDEQKAAMISSGYAATAHGGGPGQRTPRRPARASGRALRTRWPHACLPVLPGRSLPWPSPTSQRSFRCRSR